MDHSFIKTYPNALSDEACDAIMDQFWKDDWLHMPGRTTAGVDPNKKESLEIGINPELLNYNKTWHDLMQPFLKALEKCVGEYSDETGGKKNSGFPGKYKEHIGIEYQERWTLHSTYNIQYYKPTQGYKEWHTEVVGTPYTLERMLVFMLYLNTIEPKYKGGTDFYYQKHTEYAEKGKMVIWPPYWTHVHRSQISPKKEKAIITGWFTYKR